MIKNIIFILITVFLVVTNSLTYYLYQNKKSVIIKEEVIKKEIIEVKKLIKAEIKGAVITPGVYEINEDTRIIDLITLSGGLNKYADTSNINLASILKDEDSIKVYTKDELKKVEVKEVTIPTETKLISINKGSITELDSLPGIGESTAIKIIEYRDKTPFIKIEDLKNVSGIGDALFVKIKDLITI